jgi:hypothetical protein
MTDYLHTYGNDVNLHQNLKPRPVTPLGTIAQKFHWIFYKFLGPKALVVVVVVVVVVVALLLTPWPPHRNEPMWLFVLCPESSTWRIRCRLLGHPIYLQMQFPSESFVESSPGWAACMHSCRCWDRTSRGCTGRKPRPSSRCGKRRCSGGKIGGRIN